ncbi:Dihydrolipoyllysine-residue succinyltransferase component of 2-oxoglutarate dehydrogenase complex [Thalassoglobus neptunius]|uniref:Dihydrolipoyllysine-residue succinyltransferase component of 2-oxoglutarate dehydrogenase complex n=1 Tax=Thalassoglobus neptunius TaxID=1938619 RepID=A0A5C5X6F9_9PLAN|nr:Dihydrolipoyllysine-residue succinyltransferase component of 2-oxoglutarate dehydrogenase complex [Thalassoglobus neptunius]
MAVEIRVPSVGESITEVFIGEWYVKEGDWVAADQDLVGLETDKATFDVPCPEGGTITSITKTAGETAEIDEVIAMLEPGPNPNGAGSESDGQKSTQATQDAPKSSAAPAPAPSGSPGGHPMPAAERLAGENNIIVSQVSGSGPGGRILKEDVQRALTTGQTADVAVAGARDERRVPMSPMRQTIARRLVEAQQGAALLTTFNECDMSAIKELRSEYQDYFVKKFNIKLGFMSFFVKATIDALNEFPALAAQVDGNQLIYRNYHDIGVAIGSGKGLIVPAIRSAERLSFAETEQTISDFAQRAKQNKIGLDELEGGTFTITNGGVYGSLLSTPIVNPPQSGVLGMHGIVDRPVAVDGQVVIRPMMYLALTYDHRVVDGREAVSFLVRIKQTIEDPTRLLLEV